MWKKIARGIGLLFLSDIWPGRVLGVRVLGLVYDCGAYLNIGNLDTPVGIRPQLQDAIITSNFLPSLN